MKNDATQFLISHGPPLLFAVVFVEQLGVPIPALPWLLIAGALAASGKFNLPLGVAVTVLACLLSDGIWFGLGRYRGKRERVMRLLRRCSLGPESCLRRAENGTSRQPFFGVLFSKFIPGLGAVAPPLAGMFRVNAVRFFCVDAIGSLFYAACWLGIGYIFSPQVSRIEAVVARIGLGLLILIVTAVLGYSIFKLLRRTRAPKPAPDRQTENLNERNQFMRQQKLLSSGTHTRDAARPSERLSERFSLASSAPH